MSKKSVTEYEKLRAIWYKKLDKAGFKDIERDEDNLKSWTATKVNRSLHSWESKEAYYQMATNFLSDYTFASNTEKLIWEYHAEGISTRDIAKLLKNKVKTMVVSRTTMWATVRRLEKIMKKMYLSGYENKYNE